MVDTLLGPFLIDQGMNKEAIALMKGTVGSATSLFGAVIGGWLAYSAGRRTAALASGIAQAASYTLHIVAALSMGGVLLQWVATICEGVIRHDGDSRAVHPDDGRIRPRTRRHGLHLVRKSGRSDGC